MSLCDWQECVLECAFLSCFPIRGQLQFHSAKLHVVLLKSGFCDGHRPCGIKIHLNTIALFIHERQLIGYGGSGGLISRGNGHAVGFDTARWEWEDFDELLELDSFFRFDFQLDLHTNPDRSSLIVQC